MFDFWYNVLIVECCVGFMPDVTNVFQKVPLATHQSTEYYPQKPLGGGQQGVFDKCQMRHVT